MGDSSSIATIKSKYRTLDILKFMNAGIEINESMGQVLNEVIIEELQDNASINRLGSVVIKGIKIAHT